MATKKLKRCKKGTRRNPKTKRCKKTNSKVKLSEDDLKQLAYEKGLIAKQSDSIPSKIKQWMKSIIFTTKSTDIFYKYDKNKSDVDNLYKKVEAKIDSYRKDGNTKIDLTDLR